MSFAVPSSTATAGHADAFSGASDVSLALLVVIAAIFGLAWLLRRLRVLPGMQATGIEIVSQVSLGTRERAVLLKVEGERVLVGVAAGSVRALHVLGSRAGARNGTPASPPTEAEVAASEASSARVAAESAATPKAALLPPSFAAILRRSLGR
jgi:flagellar protein FliO/FliZ